MPLLVCMLHFSVCVCMYAPNSCIFLFDNQFQVFCLESDIFIFPNHLDSAEKVILAFDN